MQPTSTIGRGIPFTPVPVVNWLYQTCALALTTIQRELGTTASFTTKGEFLHLTSEQPACGGVVCVMWGTELGCRRDQCMIAWDYDVDLAVFLSEGFDFASVWLKVKTHLESLGLRLIEHTPGVKYRICPERAVAWNEWKERYQLARLENPGFCRSKLSRIASQSRKKHEPLQHPNGANCVDIEVYHVHPGADVKIAGTQTLTVPTADLFPIVEGILGPLRVPLLRTPSLLNLEYGSLWRRQHMAKVIVPSGRSSMKAVSPMHVRRGVWPSVELKGCEALLGGYSGAGTEASDHDVPWRFL